MTIFLDILSNMGMAAKRISIMLGVEAYETFYGRHTQPPSFKRLHKQFSYLFAVSSHCSGENTPSPTSWHYSTWTKLQHYKRTCCSSKGKHPPKPTFEAVERPLRGCWKKKSQENQDLEHEAGKRMQLAKFGKQA